MRTPRVLVVEPRASGGLRAHVCDEMSALSDMGWSAERARTGILERPDLAADLATIRSVRAEAASGRWDVVHAHGLRAGALAGLALRSRAASRRRGPRFVVTLHNRTTGTRAARALGAALLQVVARTADLVLGVSPDLVTSARRAGAREAQLAVIPAHPPELAPALEPVPQTALPAAPRTAEGALEVLVLARLAPQKGLAFLLDAAAIMEARAPGAVRVRIAGDGPLHDRLAERIRAQSLPVELLGRRADVPALLAAADVVVSASLWEGQPVGLQEALHAGCAIVATDAGGTGTVTREGARLVPVGDVDALAREILALREPAALERARAAARRRAAALPTMEDLATQLRVVLAPSRPRR